MTLQLCDTRVLFFGFIGFIGFIVYIVESYITTHLAKFFDTKRSRAV